MYTLAWVAIYVKTIIVMTASDMLARKPRHIKISGWTRCIYLFDDAENRSKKKIIAIRNM